MSQRALRLKAQVRMKTHLLALSALLACVMLFGACKSNTLDIYGKISGRVTDAKDGNPLSTATVTLVPGSKTQQTGADGSFLFENLDEGQYTVSVQKSGYQPNRKNLTVISGETIETVVTLTVIPQN